MISLPRRVSNEDELLAAYIAAGNRLYAAIANLPCRCCHNVPYAGCKVEQIVTERCARCSSMAEWDALR